MAIHSVSSCHLIGWVRHYSCISSHTHLPWWNTIVIPVVVRWHPRHYAFVQIFWFTKYHLLLSLCTRNGPSIVNLNGPDISQSNCARVALCLGLVNQTRISSGCSSHEWLWSMLNPTRHFALGNRARFLWDTPRNVPACDVYGMTLG